MMTIKVNLPQSISASLVKESLIRKIEENKIDTWDYKTAAKGEDVIFHNPKQYTETPEKNVIFIVTTDSHSLVFTSGWWERNPMPSDEQVLHHVTRLNALLLKEIYKPGVEVVIS